MALVLGKDNIRVMKNIAATLVERAEADGCVVCDGGGHMLVQQGAGTNDPLLLAALGAGVFAGSRELAEMLGEDNFSAVFHQGERKSIFIRAVNEEILLVVIFSKQDGAGLVKLYAAPAADRIKALLDEVELSGEKAEHEEKSFILKDGGDIFESDRTDAEE